MMLSPQAARMGTVWTTLRKIGLSTRTTAKKKFPLQADAHLFWKASFAGRWKSTQADFHEDSEDDLGYRSKGLASASAMRVTSSALVDDPWTINLHRGEDNAWLTGPRSAHDWFTGLSPKDCPGVDKQGIIRSLPLPNLSAVNRQNAKEYFNNSWTLYETLFAGLNGEEGFYRPPPHGLRHPQIFYYGHTACLYVNKLRLAGVLSKPVNAYFESIFEIGVDEMLWDDMHKNDMLWPMVSEVHAYRKNVYKSVIDAIETHPSLDDTKGSIRVDQSHPMWALFMGFEHERIHMETSSVLFRETPYHLVQRPENWPPLHPSAIGDSKRRSPPTFNPIVGFDYPENRMIAVDDQNLTVDLGKPADFPSFGWDNEYGERKVEVPPFLASEHMVTNGEFWQFVVDGGYRNKEYWCDDGFAWRTHRNLKWPFFWEPAGPAGAHEYNLRTIFEIIPMCWDWPVDVNYYESKAFCQWKTKNEGSLTSKPYRLLTEAEHHVIRSSDHNLDAARKNVTADKVMVTTGHDFSKGGSGANLNLAFSSQNPVDYFAPSQTGHRDTTGNAWEWTEDHFSPLKGFEIHHLYDDFSTPCFDGKHSMIVGGSFMSTGDEASVFARFHFRPHFLQHSGFRLVASNHDAPAKHLYAGNFEGQAAARHMIVSEGTVVSDVHSENVYETNNSLHMYLGLHYPCSGKEENLDPIFPHENSPLHGVGFPQRVARMLISLLPEATLPKRALDIGCAVGGASFELAKTFENVDAFDFSESFVNAAKQMQANEEIQFHVPVEAELYEEVRAVHDAGTTEVIRNRVHFFTGDACKLRNMAEDGMLSKASYDGVIMSNLLCRLPDPMACLEDLPCIMKKDGVIVIVTPYSWLTEFTPRSKWLGGFSDPVTKKPIYSKDVLRTVMEGNGFDKIHEEQVPLIIREHQRKYQYIVSEATGWRKVR